MKKEFTHATNLKFSTKELLAHHDVVYRSPVCDFSYGFPLGDGDSGYLLWLSEDTLYITINNTGLLDDLSEGKEYCDITEEINTSIRGGAQLSIKFPCPIFDTIYQENYEGRISIGDAAAYIHAETPFAKTDIKAFASRASKVAVLTLDADFDETMPISSELHRWGSRSFMYWYWYFRDKPQMGLDGINTTIEDGCVCITQKLIGTNFCVAVKPVSDSFTGHQKINSRAARSEFAAAEHISMTYYMTVALGEDVDCAKAIALEQIRQAEVKGAEEIYKTHAAEWEAFWDKSYISLSESQDFLENLWYLNLYYANSQLKGTLPIRPWGGLWNVVHDFSPWPNLLHYNLQHGSFPLEAANHPELNETYYRFRRNQLPYAEAYAKNMMHGKGAYYTEICDMAGRMDIDTICNTRYNATPGSQIAMGMYQHYRYTGDEEFLQNTALPVMRGTAEYYLDKLTLQEDGYYHLYHTSGYEDPFVMKDDSITDMVMIRALFAVLIPYLSQDEAAPYKDRLSKLAPFYVTDFLPDELDEEGRFLYGIGKGRKPEIDHVLSVGNNPRLPDGMTEEDVPEYAKVVLENNFNKMEDAEGNIRSRRNISSPGHDLYGFVDTELSPIFPGEILGIKDKGSELYSLVMNSMYIHPENCAIWCMMPIYLARMGMAEYIDGHIERMISEYITFPQGFDGAEMENCSNRWKRYNIFHRDTNEPSTALAYKFRHFNYETLPILATAANEMLLQSYDGTIRLFPAISEEKQAAFKLAAVGGRIVHAVYDHGECDVVIECIRGGQLSLTADHVKSCLSIFDADTGEAINAAEADGIYTLDTKAGQRIWVKTAHADGIRIMRDYSRNMDIKKLGNAKLGAEKEL